MTSYLAIVPARGGSKRVPNKNMALLGGIPLIDYTARAALASLRLTAIVVSTDSEAIAEHARQLGLTPILRPAALAADDSPSIDALRHALDAYESRCDLVDAAVVLQPTSPFRTAPDIDAAIESFERSECDTLVSVRAVHDHPYWVWRQNGTYLEPCYSLAEMALPRAALPAVYAENGAIYIAQRANVLAGTLYGSRIVPYLMSAEASIDIDTPLDMAWASFLLSQGVCTPGAGRS
jgi:CMP-N-acetylneuraminic acid synthetase